MIPSSEKEMRFAISKSHFSKKVRFVKIRSLCVSLSFAQFHREMTLRRPRQLPDTAQIEKVLFVKIVLPHHLSCFCQWSGKHPPFPLVTPEYPGHPFPSLVQCSTVSRLACPDFLPPLVLCSAVVRRVIPSSKLQA